MLYKKEWKDKNGNTQVDYSLTQGDSVDLVSTPKDEDGNLVDVTLVEKCVFKLGDSDYASVLEKEMSVDDAGVNYQLRLESSETANLDTDKYVYEVEYTFKDGTVSTPNQANFEIMSQIK